MSLQWTLVAAVLYAEIVIVFLLVLPATSPKTFQKIFRSRFLLAIGNQAQWYLAVFFFVLTLFLLDSIREIRKYSNIEHTEHSQLQAEMQTSMRLFRAQRNLYISGFALFLGLVIRRLINLISLQATLMAENEAILQQAKSATSTAEALISQTGSGEAAQNSYNEAHQVEINKLTEELDGVKKNLEKAIKDKEALISQSKALESEYDRLTNEHRKLQLKVGVESDKKSD